MLNKIDIAKILEKNESAENGSFMYKLHEDNFFDENFFIDYCKVICIASLDEYYKNFYPKIIANMSYIQSFIITHLGNLSENPEGWEVKFYGEGIKNYKDMTLKLSNIGWCCYEVISKLSFWQSNSISMDEIYDILGLELSD